MRTKIIYPHIRELFSRIEEQPFKVGEQIYTPKMSSDHIFYVSNGGVRIFTALGKKRIIKHIVIPNELFGLEGLFMEQVYLDYAESLKNTCTIKALGIDLFKQALERNANLVKEIFQLLGSKQRGIDKRLRLTTSATSECMIISFLEDLAERSGIQIGVEVLVPVMPQHKDIANLLGVARQTVSSVLSSLRKQNLIYYNRNKLLIREATRLKLDKWV